MDKAKERLQRIIRTERYANKVKQLFFDTVSEITALSKSLPVLEEGVMFSFEGENRKKQLQVERALRKLHSFATVAIEQGIDLEWEEANKTCDELLSTQFGKASLQSPFFKAWTLRNHDVRDAFAKRTDNGINLSQRIWKYVDQFRDEMEIAMTVAITEGESASEMSRKVRQYLQDPDLMFRRFRYKTGEDANGNPIYGKKWKKKVRDDKGNVRWIDYDKDSYEVGKGMYKSAYKNAMRVARTETNMAYRKADNVRWQQMDFVVGQRISLSKKHPCEDICDDLAGEYPKSFVFTGWHPQCFCYVTPILGDEDEMAKITDAFLDGKDYEPQFEQLEEYPKGFQYWVKDHKRQINESIKQGKEPYFVKDNRKAIEGIMAGNISYKKISIPDIKKNEKLINKTATVQSFADDNFASVQKLFNINNITKEQYRSCTMLHKFDLIAFREKTISIFKKYGIDFNQTTDCWNLEISNKEKFKFSLEMPSKGIKLARSFYEKENYIECHHDLFMLPINFQGKGLSKEIFRELYIHYQQMGVKNIIVTANIDIGGYTWARYGFRAINQQEALNAIALAEESGENIKQMAQNFIFEWYRENKQPLSAPFPMRILSEQTFGKKALLGSYWEGVIDITDKEQATIFENYLGIGS